MRKLAMLVLSLVVFSLSLMAQDIEFLNPKKIDLGEVKEGVMAKGSIRFVNVGDSIVKITNIRTSCGCTAAKPDKYTFAKGDTGEIKYTLKTAGFKGVVKKTIRINFEGANVQSSLFTIQLKVTSDINIIPTYVSLNHVVLNPDTTITEYFEIQNESDQQLIISKIRNQTDYLKVIPESADIAPHKSQLFRIELKPVKAGRQDTRLLIETNYAPRRKIFLPVFINISS